MEEFVVRLERFWDFGVAGFRFSVRSKANVGRGEKKDKESPW